MVQPFRAVTPCDRRSGDRPTRCVRPGSTVTAGPEHAAKQIELGRAQSLTRRGRGANRAVVFEKRKRRGRQHALRPYSLRRCASAPAVAASSPGILRIDPRRVVRPLLCQPRSSSRSMPAGPNVSPTASISATLSSAYASGNSRSASRVSLQNFAGRPRRNRAALRRVDQFFLLQRVQVLPHGHRRDLRASRPAARNPAALRF